MKRLKRLCAALSFIITLSFAVTAAANIPYAVKKGDTLQRISKKYHIGVAEIKESNGLKSNKLHAGMKLSLPDASGSTHKIRSSKRNAHWSGSPSAHKPAPDPDNGTIIHRVKKGDTLKSVARKYGITVNELKRINTLKKGKLKPGQQLIVKSKRSLPEMYIARKGDTVRKVARRFRIKADELKKINELACNTLKPGQKLYLSKKHEEPEADTIKLGGIYVGRASPAVASARLAEVKELSVSEDVLSDLSVRERLILFAKKMLHLPYRFGGDGAIGLDCSAYVQKVFSLAGQSIPRSAREQFTVGQEVGKEDLSTGDLVFFKTYASFPSHVGIYLGNNLFIHASSLSKKVTIDSLESPYYFQHFIGAKRIIRDDDDESEESPGETPAVKTN